MSRWLFKRGKFWWYRFSINGTEFKGSTKATDKATAITIAEIVRRDTVLGEHGVRKAPTLGAVAQEWLGSRGKSASPSHRRAARQSLEALGTLTRLPLDRLTTPTIQAWQARHLQDHSPASTNLVLRYLKLWVRWALGQKLIREMPSDPLKRPLAGPRRWNWASHCFVNTAEICLFQVWPFSEFRPVNMTRLPFVSK